MVKMKIMMISQMLVHTILMKRSLVMNLNLWVQVELTQITT